MHNNNNYINFWNTKIKFKIINYLIIKFLINIIKYNKILHRMPIFKWNQEMNMRNMAFKMENNLILIINQKHLLLIIVKKI